MKPAVKKEGFTLIEVLVAVAILGLALTAIFVSEAGAVKAGHRARRITVASVLARCKMAEIEEEIAREGFPAYNGDNMQSNKWRNFKIHFWDQPSMFSSQTQMNFPQVHDLLQDPKDLRGLYSGETGAENLTWVLPAVFHQILKFQETLIKEPPVSFPAPEPYKTGSFAK